MGLVSQAVYYGGGNVLGYNHISRFSLFLGFSSSSPGGYGTLEELLEVITWALLAIHDKPVGLLNVDGYYNYLLTFIDKAMDDGFIKPSRRHIIFSAPNAKELVQKLEKEGTVAAIEMKLETCLEDRIRATKMVKHVMEKNRHLQSRLLDLIESRLSRPKFREIDSPLMKKSKTVMLENPPL